MSNVLGTNFSYTWDGITSTDVMIKPSIMTPDILQLFTVRQGIKYKEQMALANPISKIVKKYTSCDRSETGTGVSITSKELTTTRLEVYLSECVDAFDATIMSTLTKDGIDYNDITGTQLQTVIQDLVTDAVRRDNFRIFSFGDTDNSSSDYSQLNGLWPTLIAGNASYAVKRIGAALGSGTLSSGTALTYLKAHYDGAPIILKQLENTQKAFFVTGSVYENLLASYESNSTGSENQFALLQMGPNGFLKYRGIDVKPIYAWDASLQADFPLGNNVQHLILYTTPGNHAIGVERASDQGNIQMWYERKDRKVYIEGMYKMGYVYIHDELQTVSF